MENNKNQEMQINSLKKSMSNPIKGMPKNGELPDDALDGVAGGAVLDSVFYIAKCNKCGWQSAPFDNTGAYDLQVVALDHLNTNPNCEGDFVIYNFDSKTVKLG